MKPGRNADCPCGSGKKYKGCCLAKDKSAAQASAAANGAGDMTTLKAQAYDCMAQIEQWQMKLRQTNEQIATLANQERPT